MSSYASLASLLRLLDDIIHRNRYPNIPLHTQQKQILASLCTNFTTLFNLLLNHPSKGTKPADLSEKLIRDVAHKVEDFIEGQLSNQTDPKEELQKLGQEVEFVTEMVKVIIDIEESLNRNFILLKLLVDHPSKGTDAADRVEKLIRDIARKVEDFFESQLSNRTVLKEELQEELQNLGQEVESVEKKVNVINIEELELKLDSVVSLQEEDIHMTEAVIEDEKTPYEETSMVGVDDITREIKEQLFGSSRRLEVLSILGMGGIGKTTLAKTLLGEDDVIDHFDRCALVTISQDYDVIKVLQNLARSISSKMDEFIGTQLIALKQHIYQTLKDRRYLIVIDDMWRTEFWDDVRDAFPNDKNNSRIILTSRLKVVAEYVVYSPEYIHEMQFLKDDESWELLQQKVFSRNPCPDRLVDVGKLLAKNCHGLPLTIVVVAGIVLNDRAPSRWKEIAENVSSILSERDVYKSLSNIFALSYSNLPYRLRACFLYMGCFPEDHDIITSKLFKLWIADGLLKSVGETKILEEVAEKCLEDLVKRSLVLVNKRRSNGQFQICALHDLIREFCQGRALKERFFLDCKEGYLNPAAIEGVRRLNLKPFPIYGPQASSAGELVRSIISFCSMDWFGDQTEWDNFTLLRVLDLLETSIWPIPDTMLQLVHLKYLGLNVDIIRQEVRLPPLSKLQHLQSLIISSPKSKFMYTSLPPEIWTLTQLRHLMVHLMILPPVPSNPGQELKYLQTLSTVKNFKFTNEVVRMIPNLRKLKLKCWTDESNGTWNSFCLNNLVHLEQLEEMEIVFDYYYRSYVESLPAGFSFPSKLKKLSLKGCCIPWNDMKAVGALSNLQVLRLRRDSLVGEDWKPFEDAEFLSLKFLALKKLNLKNWEAEDDHFPRLERLEIRECPELKGIPTEIESLKFIGVYKSKMAGVSALEIRKEQMEYGNVPPQVRIGRWKF